MNRETHQAFTILRFGFTVAPIVAGLDKFLQLLTNWDKYLAPEFSDLEDRLEMLERALKMLRQPQPA